MGARRTHDARPCPGARKSDGRCQPASPGIGALLARASTLTVVAAPRQANPRPCGHPCTQACGPPECPAPSGHPRQRTAGELPRLVITAEARGRDPHLPDLAGCGMETRGCGNLPAVLRCWRQRPGGVLTISFAPSAETLGDAWS